MIIAHRGASSIAPENTISAFQQAIDLKADAIEIDIRLSKDDSVMVIHDESIDRTTNGKGLVKNFTFEDLRQFSAGYPNKFNGKFVHEKIPTLSEVIELAKGQIQICIDLKDVSEDKVMTIINQYNLLSEVILMSYNPDKLNRIKETYPNIKLILITNVVSNNIIKDALKNNFYGISCSFLTTSFMLKAISTSGLLCWVGIVSDPYVAENLISKNINGILTNQPQLYSNYKPLTKVYPNPAINNFYLSMEDPDKITEIRFYNGNGRLLEFFKPPFQNINTFKVSNLRTHQQILIEIISQERIESHDLIIQ